MPAKNALDTTGLHIDDADLALPLSGDTELGQQEATSIHRHLATFGDHLPKELSEQHYQLLEEEEAHRLDRADSRLGTRHTSPPL